jgi:hypothetical protein
LFFETFPDSESVAGGILEIQQEVARNSGAKCRIRADGQGVLLNR